MSLNYFKIHPRDEKSPAAQIKMVFLSRTRNVFFELEYFYSQYRAGPMVVKILRAQKYVFGTKENTVLVRVRMTFRARSKAKIVRI